MESSSLSPTSPVHLGNTAMTPLSPSRFLICETGDDHCAFTRGLREDYMGPFWRRPQHTVRPKGTAHAGHCHHKSTVFLRIWEGQPCRLFFSIHVGFLVYIPYIVESLFQLPKPTQMRILRILIIALNLQINLRSRCL